MKRVAVFVFAMLLGLPGFPKGSKHEFIKLLQSTIKNFKTQVKDMEIHATVTVFTPRGKMKGQLVMYSKGEYTRQDMSFSPPKGIGPKAAFFANMKTVTISTPKAVWQITPMGKTKIDVTTMKKPHVDVQEWYRILERNIADVKKTTVKGRTVYEVTFKDAGIWKKGTFGKDAAILTIDGVHERKGRKMRIHIEFSEHSTVKGLPLPHFMKVFTNSNPMMEVRITSIKINKGLSDDLFDPDKVKAPAPSMPSIPLPGMFPVH